MLSLPSVTVSKVTTLADKSIRITLDTPELPAQTMADVFMAYKQGDQGVEIKDIKVNSKSQSKRLRDVIYRCWEHTNKEKTSEDYYREQMEYCINYFKKFLP